MDGCLAFLLLIAALTALIVAMSLRSRIKLAEGEITRLRVELDAAQERIRQLRKDVDALQGVSIFTEAPVESTEKAERSESSEVIRAPIETPVWWPVLRAD